MKRLKFYKFEQWKVSTIKLEVIFGKNVGEVFHFRVD